MGLDKNLKTEFLEYLRRGTKPRDDWRVGVEIELFGFDAQTKQRLDNAQVAEILRRLAEKHGGELIFDNDLAVETLMADGGRFTVEPGGQIEFSSAARSGLSEIEGDLREVFANLKKVGADLGLRFLAVGFDPLRTIDEQNWYLSSGYKLMKPYLATRGRRAWDMMTRTCSVQVNLDYGDERDLIKKFIVGNRLAPTVSAIFAHAPFADGADSGFKSMRVLSWLETDAHRCGVSPLAARDEFSLDDFIEYALDVPVLLLRKNGEYLEKFTGKSFREFLANSEIEPTLTDFQNHLNKIFTEARLKTYIELRAADCGGLEHSLAVAALWKGLFYDAESLDEAFRLAPKMSAARYSALQKSVAQNGLRAGGVLDLAKKIVEIAAAGLERTAPDEVKYLEFVRQRVLRDEKSPADFLLENWGGEIDRVFELTAI